MDGRHTKKVMQVRDRPTQTPPQGTQQDIGALHFDQQHHQSLLNFAAILN